MQGWDFSFLQGRTRGGDLSWSYADLAQAAISEATRALDIDTGGGELLAALQPLPPHTVATEAWEPNLRTARHRLEPLGVDVRQAADDGTLSVADAEFNLVLNRHGRLDVAEIGRALAPGGILLTQQPGSRNDLELNAALGTPPAIDPDSHTGASLAEALRNKGFRILDAWEELPTYVFDDIGAVVYQLLVVSWHVPDLDLQRYDRELRALDDRIRAEGGFRTRNHRFLVKALKESAPQD